MSAPLPTVEDSMTGDRTWPPGGRMLSDREPRPLMIRRLIPGFAGVLLGAGLALLAPWSSAQESTPPPKPAAADVVVYANGIPGKALSEFRTVKDAAAAGGVYVDTPNTGGELDPPPEDDPHVTLTANVQPGVPYRLWIHMKVGKPKGKSQANLIFAQFADAVDPSGKETLRPGTGSYLKLRGTGGEGWEGVTADSKSRRVRFKTGGGVTVRLQAGAEGVGFDQVVLSPARYLEKAPSQAVVAK